MHILIAFGSKRGGTAGLAAMIGAALADLGHEPAVRPAGQVRDLAGFDAVVVAGALYAMRWHRDAAKFVRRFRDRLRAMPVWLVSSGPLDDSPTSNEIAPTRQVRKLAASVQARGHVTFGGRLAPDAKGFPASSMAKKRSGDWRDAEQVRRFAADVDSALAQVRH